MARGAYLKDLGNTPGHLNHWSKRAFVELLSPPRRGRGGPLAVPVDHAARPGCERDVRDPAERPATSASRVDAPATARRAILSIGIASTGVVTFAYFSRRVATR